MNFLKKILGADKKDALVVLATGMLVLSRSPNSPKSESECLYNEAVISIRHTSVPFHYQLVVQKALPDGEEQIKDDGEPDDSLLDQLELGDERTFLISDSLNFHKFINSDGNTTIVWKDLSGDEGDKYAFVCDISVSETDIDKFMLAIYRCAYEKKYQKSAQSVDSVQLEKEFEYVAANDDNELLSSSELLEENSDTEPVYADLPKLKLESVLNGEVICSKSCELHLFDSSSQAFKLAASLGKIEIVNLGKYQYAINCYDGKDAVLSLKITTDLSPTFNFDVSAFIFNEVTPNFAVSWLAKFESSDALSEFSSSYTFAAWETKNKSSWNKVSDSDRDYIVDSLGGMRLEDYSEEAEEISSEHDSEEEEEEEEKIIKQSKKTVSDRSFFKEGTDRNTELAISYADNRSYVARGNRIGVFKHSEDDNEMQFQTAIENIKTSRGKSFNPEKMMLQAHGSSMVMKDSNSGGLYNMDLTKGKVVETYNVSHNEVPLDVVQINPNEKYGQLTDEKTFLGLSKRAIFKIDPRLSGSNLVEGQMTNQASANFEAITTTKQGYIATAEKNGDVKLFDRLGIGAKTKLPGLGESIKGLDVSSDGSWVLATCNTFLILFDTRIKEGVNAGYTGFQKGFVKVDKPPSLILKLLPQHVVQIKNSSGQGINFTVAHFNTGISTKETTIISSTGPYTVRWSLKKILAGQLNSYLIRKHNSNIIADDFTFGTDKNTIVAMDNDVAVVHKKMFKDPDGGWI